MKTIARASTSRWAALQDASLHKWAKIVDTHCSMNEQIPNEWPTKATGFICRDFRDTHHQFQSQ
jgi:hypothetical protein